MKKKPWILLLCTSLFLGMGTGLAIAETEETINQNEPLVVETVQEEIVNPPEKQEPLPKPSASPITDQALISSASGSIDIQAIPLSDFVSHAERKMFEIVMAVRRFSIPYAVFVLTIGGLVLMIPFKMPMQKMLGFGIIGFGMIGFLLVWFGPVLLGLAKGIAQP